MSTLSRVTLIGGAVVMIFPTVWMLLLSLHSYPERFRTISELLVDRWTLQNYIDALTTDNFAWFFVNSSMVSFAVTVSNIALCLICAYGLARKHVIARPVLWASIIGMLAVPQHVLMIPLYTMMAKWGWINTYAALIVPWMVTPFGIFFLHQYLQSLPVEIENAARLDGASEWRILIEIVAPLARPALVVLGIYTFLSNWNSFLFPFLLTNDEAHRTLPVALSFYLGKQSIDWGHVMAAASIAALPILVLFLFFQRTIITAMTSGALKG
ncbi:MAG: carbohydrate ABC transporter permease [Bacteroidota bacterium]|nr:carbohydrate ABC transporter permease [Candidatus Kapabacteria bacterium]MCX7936839.1 carbohydrate ABC transporter permease [Chlorobiota bacterium]MDW8074558.1 carbohydrate ABC transporter permease [Bacteroidota bacterium]